MPLVYLAPRVQPLGAGLSHDPQRRAPPSLTKHRHVHLMKLPSSALTVADEAGQYHRGRHADVSTARTSKRRSDFSEETPKRGPDCGGGGGGGLRVERVHESAALPEPRPCVLQLLEALPVGGRCNKKHCLRRGRDRLRVHLNAATSRSDPQVNCCKAAWQRSWAGSCTTASKRS